MIHRDIKPENLLIDSNDKVKLCDFGWCVVNQDTTTRSTYCGTLEYMAPEMLHNGQHNHTLDLWAMGVLLYELLHGHAPFTGRAHLEIKKKIMRKEVVFRDGLTDDVKDLIISLLQHEAKHRLPLMKVLIHPWVMKMSEKFHLIEPNLLDSLELPKKQNIADFYEMPPKKKGFLSSSLLESESALSSRAPHTSSLLGNKEDKKRLKLDDGLALRELVTERGAPTRDQEMLQIREMKNKERKLSDQIKREAQENGAGEEQGDLKMLRDMKLKDGSKRKIKDFLAKGPLAEVEEEQEQKTQASTRSRASQQISHFLNDKEDEEGQIIGLLKQVMPKSQREDDLDKMCKDMEDQMHIFEQLRKSKMMNSKPPDMLNKNPAFSPLSSSHWQEGLKHAHPDQVPPLQSEDSQEEIKDNQPPSLLELMQGTKGGPEEDNQPQIKRKLSDEELPNTLRKIRSQRSLDPNSQRQQKFKKGGTAANLTLDNIGLELDLTCQRGRGGAGSNRKDEHNRSLDQDRREVKTRQKRALQRLSKDIRSKGTSGKHLLYEDAAYKAKWLKKLDPQTHLEQDYLPRKYIYGHKNYDESTKQMMEAIEANEAEFTIFKSDYDKLPPDEQFRLRNQKQNKGGFWESLWRKMSNPFGCGSTSRKEDSVSAK